MKLTKAQKSEIKKGRKMGHVTFLADTAKEAAAFLEAVLPIDERMLAILLRKKFRAMLK